MMKKLLFLLAFLMLFSCDKIPENLLSGKVTEAENAAGLKEALNVGAKFALNKLGAQDGFFRDEAVKILLPEDAANLVRAAQNIPVINTLVNKAAEDFIFAMNRAAEASITEVIPVVAKAITDMSIQDAGNILFSSDHLAATHYLHSKTYTPLCGICQSVIEDVLDRNIVGQSTLKAWETLTGFCNQVPGINIETNLAEYATRKTLDGVFLKVGGEEEKIRTDVNARVTDLLRRVFGQLN